MELRWRLYVIKGAGARWTKRSCQDAKRMKGALMGKLPTAACLVEGKEKANGGEDAEASGKPLTLSSNRVVG